MILRTEFAVLGARLRDLAEAWRALTVCVVEDRPPGDGLAVSDHLAEVVADGTGELLGALGSGVWKPTADSLNTAACTLVRLRSRLESEFRSYPAGSRLRRSVRERGRQWRGWARSVESGVDRCAESLEAAENAMLRCWSEVVELAGLDKCGASS
jgi:hypothetical protein